VGLARVVKCLPMPRLLGTTRGAVPSGEVGKKAADSLRVNRRLLHHRKMARFVEHHELRPADALMQALMAVERHLVPLGGQHQRRGCDVGARGAPVPMPKRAGHAELVWTVHHGIRSRRCKVRAGLR